MLIKYYHCKCACFFLHTSIKPAVKIWLKKSTVISTSYKVLNTLRARYVKQIDKVTQDSIVKWAVAHKSYNDKRQQQQQQPFLYFYLCAFLFVKSANTKNYLIVIEFVSCLIFCVRVCKIETETTAHRHRHSLSEKRKSEKRTQIANTREPQYNIYIYRATQMIVATSNWAEFNVWH